MQVLTSFVDETFHPALRLELSDYDNPFEEKGKLFCALVFCFSRLDMELI